MLKFDDGIINAAINKLPFEIHLPGYQYCGPGTKLQERLARNDPGINLLDAACKEHDIAYSRNKDLENRHEADRVLAEKAWRRVKESSSWAEKLAALSVTAAMKTKTRLGMGMKKQKRYRKGKGMKKRKTCLGASFREIVKNARVAAQPFKHVKEAVTQALEAARRVIKGRKKSLPPRIIPIPKTGGILPLIPLFAGLSALGALAGGVSGITKAVNDTSAAKKQLKESERHNQTMESIALRGRGLYLRPYRRGYGLFLNPEAKNYRGGR